MQLQTIDHLHLRGPGEGKQTVPIRRPGQLSGVTVRSVAANAEAFDAQGVEQLDERLVFGTEIALSVFARQQ